MQNKGPGAVPFLGHRGEPRMLLRDHDRLAEEIAEQHVVDVRPPRVNRRNRQQHQRHRHDPGTLARIAALAVRLIMPRLLRRMRYMSVGVPEALLAVKRQEHHTERVERSNEHADGHRELRVAMPAHRRELHRFDDCVLGEKAGERRDTRERH